MFCAFRDFDQVCCDGVVMFGCMPSVRIFPASFSRIHQDASLLFIFPAILELCASAVHVGQRSGTLHIYVKSYQQNKIRTHVEGRASLDCSY
nr:hypothetical protein CFP56_35015 [Quercus suber]